MKVGRAIVFGVLGAASMSALAAFLRAAGVPIYIEMLLGTLTGLSPGALAFFVGLVAHLAIGGAIGLAYGWLFERVWDHGGAGMGMIFGLLHASAIGMFVGLTPQFHPLVPNVLPAPGPYFSSGGTVAVLSFFLLHVLYGAIVGGGYGHTPAEREWAPTGRL